MNMNMYMYMYSYKFVCQNCLLVIWIYLCFIRYFGDGKKLFKIKTRLVVVWMAFVGGT